MTSQLKEGIPLHLGETVLMAVLQNLSSCVIYKYLMVGGNQALRISLFVSGVIAISLLGKKYAFVIHAERSGGLGFIERESTIQKGSGS